MTIALKCIRSNGGKTDAYIAREVPGKDCSCVFFMDFVENPHPQHQTAMVEHFVNVALVPPPHTHHGQEAERRAYRAPCDTRRRDGSERGATCGESKHRPACCHVQRTCNERPLGETQ